MHTLNARRVLTEDKALWNNVDKNFKPIKCHYDVELFTDKEIKARIMWYKKSKPDKRYKYFFLNGFKYRLKWV